MGVVSAMLAMVSSHVDRALVRARPFGLHVVVAILLFSPGGALAHAQLDRGVKAADEGRFDEALRLLTRAIEGERLSRGEFLQALEQRTLVNYALHRRTDLQRDLDLLLAIDPTVDFGGAAPPDLNATIEKRRKHAKPMEIEAHIEDLRGEVRVWAVSRLVSDGYALRTLVGVRSPDGSWQLSYDGQVQHRPPVGGTVDYFAAVVGPGGSVLVSDGSEDAPKVHRLKIPLVVETTQVQSPSPPPSPSPISLGPREEGIRDANPRDEGTRNRRGLWWTLGSASALAVVTTIVVFIARSAAPQSPEVQGPSVEYP